MILSTPLEWPAGTPSRKPSEQKYGRFKSNQSDITVSTAVSRLNAELWRMGANNAELSANFSTTRAGNVSQMIARELDQSVCLRFNIGDIEFVLPCDAYTTAADNIAALAAHIEATRAIERHGVATTKQALQAFAALPPPSNLPVVRPKRDWWTVLGLFPEADLDMIEAVYRVKAKKLHPDAGGSTEDFQELQSAIAEAREEKK